MNPCRIAAVLALAAMAPAQTDEEQVKPLLVMITAQWDDSREDPTQNGAGIIVGHSSDRLYIATANHVVRKGARAAKRVEAEMTWLPGEPKLATITPRHFDANLDIAVLILSNASSLAVPRLPFDRLGDSTKLARRDIVRAMGYPWYVSPLDDRVSTLNNEAVRFASTSVRMGYSGGALFNDKWEIVGIMRTDQPPEGEAVRMDRVIEKLKEWGYPVQLGAGVKVTLVPPPKVEVEPVAGQ